MDPCERALLIPAPHQAVALESRDVRALHSHSAGVYRSQVRARQLRAGRAGVLRAAFQRRAYPTQRIVVIPTRDLQREARTDALRPIPSWAKDASIGPRLINARAEDNAGLSVSAKVNSPKNDNRELVDPVPE